MRWRLRPEQEWPRDHWEQLVRTIIERIGLEQLCEIIENVVITMREENPIVAQKVSRPRSSAEASPTVGGSAA